MKVKLAQCFLWKCTIPPHHHHYHHTHGSLWNKYLRELFIYKYSLICSIVVFSHYYREFVLGHRHSSLCQSQLRLQTLQSSLWVLNKPNANNACCLYHMTHGVRPCSGRVSITSILLTGCCQRWVGRAAAIYVACEIGGDNNGCHCQAGAGQRQDQLACSFWDCQSLSSMSAATLQLPLSVACTLRLHPAEYSQSASRILSYVAQPHLKRSTSNQ